jgi:hypothetical protein
MNAAEARLKVHGAVLAERHALQEAEYRTILAESEKQGGRVAERLMKLLMLNRFRL